MNIGPAWRRWRPILFFGAAGGLLVASLRFIEYRFLVVEHSIEIYSGLIALLFAAVGIRLGLTLTKTREVTVIKEVAVAAPIEFVRNEQQVATLAITPRELDILDQIAAGKSTREIAQDLFVSENTVKTHVARVLMKLGVRDRVQAVVAAYESGLVRPTTS